jgi:hypothetical protein
MITRWPSQITATRRDKIDDLRVSGQPRLNGKLSPGTGLIRS